MFEMRRTTSRHVVLLNVLEVTYHTAVRKVRKGHRNAVVAIGMSVFQTMLFVAAFYVMLSILGGRQMGIRGDFVLYLLSGVFLYLVHVQALQKVMASETRTSPLMQHAPMNTLVTVLSSAVSVLYVKSISLLVILFLLHALSAPLAIHDWHGALMMYLLAWGTGAAIGAMLLAVRPWAPDVIAIVQTIYVRANMIASGKLFVANVLPVAILPLFDWNPLFHVIDQMRGFVFVNYVPVHTTWQLPLVTLAGIVLVGMMLDFQTRRHASMSWDAPR
jgi:ABC-type polysaccharide/polyol phosphate export permease